MKRSIAWAFKEPESQFIWACLLVAVFPIPLWTRHSPATFEASGLVLQLAGLGIALVEVLELRKNFSDAGGLFSRWWAARPWRKPAPVNAVAGDSVLGSDVSRSLVLQGRAKAGIEEDINRLWENFEVLRQQVESAHLRLDQQKREHAQHINDLKDIIERRAKQAKAEVQEAVVGNPFNTLFGLWVVAVATLMQLCDVLLR